MVGIDAMAAAKCGPFAAPSSDANDKQKQRPGSGRSGEESLEGPKRGLRRAWVEKRISPLRDVRWDCSSLRSK